MVVEDQVKSACRVDPLPERDVDRLVEVVGVVLAGFEPIERGEDRFLLADRAKVGPGGGDLAGRQDQCPDLAERCDIPILVPGPRRFGKLAERAGLSEREPEVRAGREGASRRGHRESPPDQPAERRAYPAPRRVVPTEATDRAGRTLESSSRHDPVVARSKDVTRRRTCSGRFRWRAIRAGRRPPWPLRISSRSSNSASGSSRP